MPGYFIRQAAPIGTKLKLEVVAADGSPDTPYSSRAWIVLPDDKVRNWGRAQLAKTVSVPLVEPGAVYDGHLEIVFAGDARVALRIWIERADGTTYSKRVDRELSGTIAEIWSIYCRVAAKA